MSFLIWEFDECPCLLLFSLALCPQYIFLYSIHTKSIFLMTLPVFTAIWLINHYQDTNSQNRNDVSHSYAVAVREIELDLDL